MKRLLAVLFSTILLFSLSACGERAEGKTDEEFEPTTTAVIATTEMTEKETESETTTTESETEETEEEWKNPYDFTGKSVDEIYDIVMNVFSTEPEYGSDPVEWLEKIGYDPEIHSWGVGDYPEYPVRWIPHYNKIKKDFAFSKDLAWNITIGPFYEDMRRDVHLGEEKNISYTSIPYLHCEMIILIEDYDTAMDLFTKFVEEQKKVEPLHSQIFYKKKLPSYGETIVYQPGYEYDHDNYMLDLVIKEYKIMTDEADAFTPSAEDSYTVHNRSRLAELTKQSSDYCIKLHHYWVYPEGIIDYSKMSGIEDYTIYDDIAEIWERKKENGEFEE